MNRPKVIFSYCILLMLLFNCNKAFSQKLSYVHYDTKSGLAGSTVFGITQDKDGFLWFGTETGLSRFDGTSFKNFTIADGLPNNQVFGLYSDRKNRVWINCFKNEICYYYKGRIYNVHNDPMLKQVVLKSWVTSIAENERGDIILRSNEHRYLLRNDRKVILLSGPASTALIAPFSFKAIGGFGQFSTNLANVPAYLQKRSGLYDHLILNPKSTHRLNNYVFQDSVLYPNGPSKKAVLFFDGRDTTGRLIPIPQETSHILYVNERTLAMLRNYNGTTLCDLYNNEFSGNYLTRYTVQSVFEDMEHNLWFSTKNFGVFKISNARFKNYFFDDLGVRDIHEKDGHIFIGTDNAKYWDIPALTSSDFNRDSGMLPKIIRGSVMNVLEERREKYINYASSDFLHLDQDGYFSPGSVKTLHIFGDTLLLAGSHYSFSQSITNRRILDTLYRGRSTCAFRQNGIYYIGTIEGLYRVVHGKVPQFMGDIDPRFACQISQIAEGHDGTLWISTYERGVIGYKNDRIVAHIRKDDGLTSDICRCLFLSDNFLWVGTDKGLNKVKLFQEKPVVITRYRETDGLNSDIVSSVYTSGTIVYVGTALGMTVFDETRVPIHAICKIKLNKVLVSGINRLPYGADLIMQHNDNNIRFEFSGISFLSGGHLNFKYRLLGLNDKWEISDENMLSYPSLPSGKYKLQIICINKFGDESEMLEYGFEIKKMIWEHWWFQLLLLVLVIAGIVFIVRFLVRRSELKEKEKLMNQQRLMELEQMALQGQLNPHFIFNNIAAIKQYYNIGSLKTANRLVDMFSSLIRQTFEMGTEIFVSLSKELNYINQYLSIEQIRFSDSFDFHIKTDLNLPENSIMVPGMLLQPLIENAVRHGVRHLTDRKGEIIVQITQEGEQVEIVITDNGIGRARSLSIGKAFSKTARMTSTVINSRRIDILNKLFGEQIIQRNEDIISEKNETIGTRVTISYPLNIQHSLIHKQQTTHG